MDHSGRIADEARIKTNWHMTPETAEEIVTRITNIEHLLSGMEERICMAQVDVAHLNKIILIMHELLKSQHLRIKLIEDISRKPDIFT